MVRLYVYSWIPRYGAEPKVGTYKDGDLPLSYAECVADAKETIERVGGMIWLYEAYHDGRLAPVSSWGNL